MTEPISVLAVSGSLRKASFNTALMRTAIEVARAEALPIRFEIGEIRDLPLYDEDVRAQGFPTPVEKLREQIRAADAILFVTPEYNYSIPGVLKNAIDWVSRPPDQPFADKPIAIMGASGGAGGTMRSQYHLRQVAVQLDMHVLNKPELFIAKAGEKFDAEGKLLDATALKLVAKQLAALIEWTRRIAPKPTT